MAYGELTEADWAEIDAIESRAKKPPCLRCKARTVEEAAIRCRPNGDAECPGLEIWPEEEPRR